MVTSGGAWQVEGWLRPCYSPCKAAVGVEKHILKGNHFPSTQSGSWRRWRSLTQGLSKPGQTSDCTAGAFLHPKGSEGNLIHPLTVLSWGHWEPTATVSFQPLPGVLCCFACQWSQDQDPNPISHHKKSASEPLHWKNQEAWFHWSLAFFIVLSKETNNQKLYFQSLNFIPLVYYTAHKWA